MLKFFSRLLLVLSTPTVRLIVTLQSERQRLKTLFQDEVTHFETAYNGEKILLLALYQKGRLRPDVQRMLATAKAQGLYVLAVNTLKISDPDSLRDLVDCYIERPNFGRDFGSYQTGFQHVYAKGWDQTCPRLMMLNDSVFFTETRMGPFLHDMMDSDVEVLGSTENFDIEYHLGSFCIALSGTILKQDKLRTYWRKYVLSDLRPNVIKRGEMKLSKVLKSCASAPSEFTALYSGVRYLNELENDPELLDFSIRNVRASTINPWKRASLKSVTAAILDRFFFRENAADKSDSRITLLSGQASTIEAEQELHFVGTPAGLKDFLKRLEADDKITDDTLRLLFMEELADGFFTGSHIHQNPIILLKQGLPIIKNDGVYRGLLTFEDIYKMSALLQEEEALEMRKLLLDRPYGGHHLEGWKRAAFNLGYL